MLRPINLWSLRPYSCRQLVPVRRPIGRRPRWGYASNGIMEKYLSSVMARRARRRGADNDPRPAQKAIGDHRVRIREASRCGSQPGDITGLRQQAVGTQKSIEAGFGRVIQERLSYRSAESPVNPRLPGSGILGAPTASGVRARSRVPSRETDEQHGTLARATNASLEPRSRSSAQGPGWPPNQDGQGKNGGNWRVFEGQEAPFFPVYSPASQLKPLIRKILCQPTFLRPRAKKMSGAISSEDFVDV